MKAALLAFTAGLLLVIVLSTDQPNKCGCNMTTTHCAPCSPICNEPPRPCPEFCTLNETFCICKPGFSLPLPNSNHCIPTDECPQVSNETCA